MAGVTTFPAILADRETRRLEPTPNFTTLRTAADRLRAAGFSIEQVNAPGTTSAGAMALLAAGGATHVEPGNGLHGTTAADAVRRRASRRCPAIVYVSRGVPPRRRRRLRLRRAGCTSTRCWASTACGPSCGRDEAILERAVPAEMAPDGAIHYYAKLHLEPGHDVRVGDTVVFCFRPQVFVTRARTRAISGIRGGLPQLGAAYDVEARPVTGAS